MLHTYIQPPESLSLTCAELDSSQPLFQGNFIPMNNTKSYFIYLFIHKLIRKLFILFKEMEQRLKPPKP